MRNVAALALVVASFAAAAVTGAGTGGVEPANARTWLRVLAIAWAAVGLLQLAVLLAVRYLRVGRVLYFGVSIAAGTLVCLGVLATAVRTSGDHVAVVGACAVWLLAFCAYVAEFAGATGAGRRALSK